MLRYRIGEFAELAGVSIKTLRFYDEIGLLRPAGTDPRTRYRHYFPQQLEELASIVALKDLGISLSEIRALLGKTGPRKSRHELLIDVRRSIERSIRTATQSLSWVNAALAELDGSEPVSIVVKRRPAIPIASVRARVQTYADIVPLEQDLLKAIPDRSAGDLRGVLWHRCADSGSLEGEPFVAINGQVPASSAYDRKILPSASLACAYSSLDDESAERTYAALRRWVSAHDYSLDGPKREIYIDKMLEIQFPFKPGRA